MSDIKVNDEKHERIINAAMEEFVHGFAQAKTDNIAKAAGVSKGLLFHYFGTKEKLFAFLIDNAIRIIRTEFLDRVNPRQPDLIETIWQMSLLKQEVSRRYPAMFDFLTSTYLDTRHSIEAAQIEQLTKFTQMRNQILAEAVAHCDRSRFRQGIEPERALEIIDWTLKGYAEAMTNRAKQQSGISQVGADARENYERYLSEFKVYIDIFRQCFYK